MATVISEGLEIVGVSEAPATEALGKVVTPKCGIVTLVSTKNFDRDGESQRGWGYRRGPSTSAVVTSEKCGLPSRCNSTKNQMGMAKVISEGLGISSGSQKHLLRKHRRSRHASFHLRSDCLAGKPHI